ncbi:MarR family transcriptional regulator [Gordonia sp. QH-12]|uniref:MarR family winged helix-turn-helix transcriptional regulator n=1 Tax=Gordonia sp. QH-12 TaxID=1437876 RepID=UPI00078084F4|nr:MarR family transcriptional regulator [Gordonia sp. QH-12]
MTGKAPSEDLLGDSLSARLGFQLVKAAIGVRRAYAAELRRHGLLPHQHAILAVLVDGEGLYQRQLAEAVRVDPPDLVPYIDGLVKEGLAARSPDPKDRRRQIVTITPAGTERLGEADRGLDVVESALFRRLSSSDRSRLRKVLAEIDQED